jgi:hypothetical protein
MQTLDAMILTSIHWAGTIALGLGIFAMLVYASVAAAWYLIRHAWEYEMSVHVIWHCWNRTRFTRAPRDVTPIRPGHLRKYNADRAAELEVELDAAGVGPAPENVAAKQDGGTR